MRFRDAVEDDLYSVIGLLSDDILGATREIHRDPPVREYRDAFARMQAYGGNRLIVAENDRDEVKGCLQLTITPGLARRGAIRATIEGVRVSRDERGSGLGTKLLKFAIDEAKAAGCALVQLTTDSARPDAARFYERLGFEASHIGMKLHLNP